jgi:hypothetical protein
VISRSRERENRKSKEKIGHQEEDRRGVANSSGLKQIKSALGGKGERRREGMMGGHLYIEPSRGGGWTMEGWWKRLRTQSQWRKNMYSSREYRPPYPPPAS